MDPGGLGHKLAKPTRALLTGPDISDYASSDTVAVRILQTDAVPSVVDGTSSM